MLRYDYGTDTRKEETVDVSCELDLSHDYDILDLDL
jgi:hypothetical protein